VFGLLEPLAGLPPGQRALLIIAMAVVGHLLVRGIRVVGEWILTPASAPGMRARDLLERRNPKVATVTSLVVSALTFFIYFAALGLLLREVNVDPTAYIASASVVGLAVAFGLQGLVQDVVIGITLVFTDTFDVGDVVEISGQVGRVEKIGLRFTMLLNLHGQRVFVPNRSIAMVARFRRGAVRAYLDVQIPAGAEVDDVRARVGGIVRAMWEQHPTILVTEPELLGVLEAGDGAWRYLRVKFRLWPGQNALIEGPVRQRIVSALRELDGDYADWMITISFRAD
jgi:moderate conductance mechanosensitive channel